MSDLTVFRVIVPVEDVEAGAAFYSALFKQAGERVSPGRHYFNAGGVILACYDARADGDDDVPHTLDAPIYISTSNLEETHACAQTSGASFVQTDVPSVGVLGAICVRPWGERSFYAIDPFGNHLCFVDAATRFEGGRSREVRDGAVGKADASDDAG